MTAQIIDGKAIAEQIRREVGEGVAELLAAGDRQAAAALPSPAASAENYFSADHSSSRCRSPLR